MTTQLYNIHLTEAAQYNRIGTDDFTKDANIVKCSIVQLSSSRNISIDA